jgi:hypothetical protein
MLLVPFGTVVCILAQSFLFSRRFSKAFTEAEMLKQELERLSLTAT